MEDKGRHRATLAAASQVAPEHLDQATTPHRYIATS